MPVVSYLILYFLGTYTACFPEMLSTFIASMAAEQPWNLSMWVPIRCQTSHPILKINSMMNITSSVISDENRMKMNGNIFLRLGISVKAKLGEKYSFRSLYSLKNLLQHVEALGKLLLRKQVRFFPMSSKQLGKVVEAIVIKGR